MPNRLPLFATVIAAAVFDSGLAAEDWAFAPEPDTFSEQALVDLRSLNETVAGETGFITRSKSGDDFVRGDGKPIRFWAINSGAYNKHPRFAAPDLDRHARFLAKRGVNMMRFHGNVTTKGDDIDAINTQERDGLWRTIASMKKAGIYVTFSPYWANSSQVKPGAHGVLASEQGNPHGLLFFDERLQAAYKSWWKQILTEPNPHTGIALKDDPALAIIQLQNEDSLLFWTAQGIKGAAGKVLRQRFASFAATKHGSIEQALAAWGGTRHDEDGADELGLYIVWELTGGGNVTRSGSAGAKARAADQSEFLARMMYDFNAMMARYLRDELGAKQIVNAGNWKTADNVRLNDLERWSYTANEVVATNRYYTGIHKGEHNGWAIVPGDEFTDPSVIRQPREFPLTLRLVSGHPMLITESAWVPPLAKQSEGPFLIGAYSALTGFDGYYWFATGEEMWRQPGSANGYLNPSAGKWVVATPMQLGQFPANAFAYRTNLIKQGKTVVHEERSLESLWRRDVPAIPEDAGFDPNRDAGDAAANNQVRTEVDQLAYLAGPVSVTYGTAKDAVTVANELPSLMTPESVRSITGELTWNHVKGVVSVNAPAIQGASGFLAAAGSQQLADVTIASSNDYATVVAVALDGKPLKTSRKVLIQVGTEARPTGWKTEPARIALDNGARHVDGERIVSVGTAPWRIQATATTLTIANAALTTAIVCDANFQETSRLPLERAGAKRSLTLPADTLYIVLTD